MINTFLNRFESSITHFLRLFNHPEVQVIKEAFQDLVLPLSMGSILHIFLRLNLLNASPLWTGIQFLSLQAFSVWLVIALSFRMLHASTLPMVIYLFTLLVGSVAFFEFELLNPLTIPLVIIYTLLGFYFIRILHRYCYRLFNRMPAFLQTHLIPLLVSFAWWMVLSVLRPIMSDFVWINTSILQMISLLNQWPVLILVNGLIVLLWYFGYHGTNLLSVILLPLAMYGLLMNLQNSNMYFALAGYAHIIFGNWTAYYALVSLCLLTTKSKRLKQLGQVAWKSSLFNINEHLIFGLQVKNRALLSPILIASLSNILLYALALNSQWIDPIIYMSPFTLILPLQVLWASFSLRTLTFWFILFLFNIVLFYLPIRTIDRKERIQEVRFKA
jgi:cellobiose PTS system EIIC component